jgi:hypothetical protein
MVASPDEQRGYGGMQPCTGCERHNSSRTADLQLYSHSQRKKRPAALVLLYRTGELAQPAQQPAHQNLLVEPPLAWQPGHRLRRITARIPSLKMDLSATAVRPVQVLVVATARKSTPLHLYTFSDFPKFPKKHWLSVSHLKGIVSKY